MWVVFAFATFLIVALVLPPAWTLWPVWRGAHKPRQVTCPAAGSPALVTLSPWVAMRSRALGDQEQRVTHCTRWPEARACGQECLEEACRRA